MKQTSLTPLQIEQFRLVTAQHEAAHFVVTELLGGYVYGEIGIPKTNGNYPYNRRRPGRNETYAGYIDFSNTYPQLEALQTLVGWAFEERHGSSYFGESDLGFAMSILENPRYYNVDVTKRSKRLALSLVDRFFPLVDAVAALLLVNANKRGVVSNRSVQAIAKYIRDQLTSKDRILACKIRTLWLDPQCKIRN